MTVETFTRKQIFLSYVTILRVVNGIVSGFAATFGIVLSLPIGSEVDYLTIGLVVLAAALVSSQAMIFNDIADREEDAINAPHRPLPSGKISVKAAVIYGCIVASLALIVGVIIDIRENLYGLSVVTVLLFGGLLNLYDFKLKKLGFLGNVTIGINVIGLFIYGSIHTFLVYDNVTTTNVIIPILIGIAAAGGIIGREVIKGLPDIEGDRKAGAKTLAVKFGPKKTAVIASVFLWFLAAGAIIGLILAKMYIPTFVIAILLAIMVAFLAIRILFNQTPKWAYTTKEILLIVFLVFLLDFIIDAIVKLAIG